jgi:hypothetical protein
MIGDSMAGGFLTTAPETIRRVLHSKFWTNWMIARHAEPRVRDGGSLTFTILILMAVSARPVGDNPVPPLSRSHVPRIKGTITDALGFDLLQMSDFCRPALDFDVLTDHALLVLGADYKEAGEKAFGKRLRDCVLPRVLEEGTGSASSC